MDKIRTNKAIFSVGGNILFCCLIFIFLFFVVFQNNVMAQQYQALPDNFADQEAISDTGWLDVYTLQPRNDYTSFKFFIPPGTTSINFFFTSRSIAAHGPHIYLSSRIGAPPTATRSQFESIESTLPNVNSSLNAPAVKELQEPSGYMAKRVQNSGDRVWVVSDVAAEGVLPSSYKSEGGWVYVNLLDKNGYDTINILSISSRIKVDPEVYNRWRETMNFPSPDPGVPADPEFGFSFSRPDVPQAEPSKEYTTDVKFQYFEESKEISISGGGEYQIDDGDWTSSNESSRTVNKNQSVRVRLLASSEYSQEVSTTLTIGDIFKTFRVKTKTDPDDLLQIIAFEPRHVPGVEKNKFIESNEINVVVFGSITISAPGEYSINGGDYTSQAGTVKPGDKVRVRLESSSEDHKTEITTLTIGSASGLFRVTTAVGSGGGGNSGPLPDLCALWPDLPGCGGNPEPNPPDLEPQIHVEISVQPKGFNHQEVPSGDRGGPELLEVNIELPSNWPGSGSQSYGYMFGLLDIPGSGLFLAQMDIFGQVLLFPYDIGDPLVPFGIEPLNGQGAIQTSPFATLQSWQMTAGGLADLGAVFYIAIVSDGDWDNYVGGSFAFTGGSGTSSVHAFDFLDAAGSAPYLNGSELDQLSGNSPLVIEASFGDFTSKTFEAQENSEHQPLILDARLPHGWEEMLDHAFDGKNPEEIEWSVYTLIVLEESHEQFLARADIHLVPRLIPLDSYTPIRPASRSQTLSSGSDVIALSPCIDGLKLTPYDFARLGLHFYLALVPDGDWDNYFGLHFNFEEVEE